MTVADTKLVTQAQTLSPDAAATARQAKLTDAAQKFEGIMLEELLKPMQRAGSAGGGGFDGEDESSADQGAGDPAIAGYSSYGVQAMAEALSKSGGLGIAKEVLRQIDHQIGRVDEKNQNKSSSTKV